jgi:hypothetical protein
MVVTAITAAVQADQNADQRAAAARTGPGPAVPATSYGDTKPACLQFR